MFALIETSFFIDLTTYFRFNIKTRQLMNDNPQLPKSALQNKQYLAVDCLADFHFFAFQAYTGRTRFWITMLLSITN